MCPNPLPSSHASGSIPDLQASLGYRFQNSTLLDQALTHASSLNEDGRVSSAHNERLEFLGDAVLDLVISDTLMRRFETSAEGMLSKMKASLVSRTVLARVAQQLILGSYLRLGRGEEMNAGREKPSLLANTLEALMGAIYLDGGFEAAQEFVLHVYEQELDQLRPDTCTSDAKSQLQEISQKQFGALPSYQLLNISGPDHLKTFEVEVQLNNQRYGMGTGTTKKEAEQQAAHAALRRWQHDSLSEEKKGE